MQRPKLGDKVKDTVTGCVGIAVARTELLNGCPQITIQPRATWDMYLPEAYTCDEKQVEVVIVQDEAK